MTDISSPAEEAKRHAVETGAAYAELRLNMAIQATVLIHKASYLYQAVEMAARAAVTSWGRPMAGSKVWIALFRQLSPHLDPEVVAWARDVEAKGPDGVHALLLPAAHHIDSIIALTMRESPEDFQSRPGPLRWDELTAKDRAFLQDAARRASAFAYGSDLWLFGSRATGEAREDSDYDVRLIVPDGIPKNLLDLARGEIWQTAKDHGVRIDHDSIERSEFEAPDLGKDVLLTYEIKAYGLQVPPLPG